MKYTVISDYFKNDIFKSVKFRDFFSLLWRNRGFCVYFLVDGGFPNKAKWTVAFFFFMPFKHFGKVAGKDE